MTDPCHICGYHPSNSVCSRIHDAPACAFPPTDDRPILTFDPDGSMILIFQHAKRNIIVTIEKASYIATDTDGNLDLQEGYLDLSKDGWGKTIAWLTSTV